MHGSLTVALPKKKEHQGFIGWTSDTVVRLHGTQQKDEKPSLG